jgi:cytochrome c peroxidase
MRTFLFRMLLVAAFLCTMEVFASEAPGASPPLGLPMAPEPADNPQTPEKISLGKKLFEDKRFSSTG